MVSVVSRSGRRARQQPQHRSGGVAEQFVDTAAQALDVDALLRCLLFEYRTLERHRQTLGESLQLFEMVHRYDSMGFGAVAMQNADCPRLNGDRGGDIAKGAGNLDELLKSTFVIHWRRRKCAAPLADELRLQRSVP